MGESGEKRHPTLGFGNPLATFCIVCHIVVRQSCLDRVLKLKLREKYLWHTSLKKEDEKKGEEKNM